MKRKSYFKILQYIVHGESDGFVWKRMSAVYEVDYASRYEKKVGRIYRLKKQEHRAFEKTKASLLFSLLEHAKTEKRIIRCGAVCGSAIGVVKNYNDAAVIVCEVDFSGKSDGVAVIRYDEIETIKYDGIEEQNIFMLMKEMDN